MRELPERKLKQIQHIHHAHTASDKLKGSLNSDSRCDQRGAKVFLQMHFVRAKVTLHDGR